MHPSKAKKASGKPGKKTTAASAEETVNQDTSSQNTEQNDEQMAQELRNKALQDGDEVRDLFWANLAKASEEPSGTISDEDKAKLPKGIELKSAEETKSSAAKAMALLEEKKYVEAAAEVDLAVKNAALDEELLGELYFIRGRARLEQKQYFDAVRDLSFAKNLLYMSNGATLFYRMRAYIELGLPLYSTLDYDALAAEYQDYPELKSFKSKASGPLPHDLQKLVQKFMTSNGMPPSLKASYIDLVKATIVLALQQNFGYEELGSFLYAMKKADHAALNTPAKFGRYLRDVFAANDMEDISEVFTHFIPEHEVPIECNINEVMVAINIMGEGCHLIHQIGFAMCWSLAWTPSSMWNLQCTLFKDHIKARFALQRALWHDYHATMVERISRDDDDVSYTCNGGIGEIPPPHARVDYLYVSDSGASDYIRLHAEATAKGATEVIEELKQHVPLNAFHVTMAPMIFAAARDAMPKSVEFMIKVGAEVNIMDAAEETPLDAARVALEFRMDMLHDHGYIVPIEEFQEVERILKESGAKAASRDRAQSAFEKMFSGGGDDEDYEEDGEEGANEEDQAAFEEHLASKFGYGEQSDDGEEHDEEDEELYEDEDE